MKHSFKIGVSLLALSAGMALAQTPETKEQGGKAQAPAEHSQPTQQKEKASPERGSGAEHAQGTERSGQKPATEQKRETQAEEQRGTGERKADEKGSKATETQHTEKSKDETRGSTTSKQAETQKSESNDRARASTENTKRPDAGTNTVVEERRDTTKRADIKISPEQKTRVHDVIVRDSAIRKYSRNDIHVSINVGTRLPETVVYYDPPTQLIEINPAFRAYKVILLDDGTLLIVDPATREIVDVIAI